MMTERLACQNKARECELQMDSSSVGVELKEMTNILPGLTEMTSSTAVDDDDSQLVISVDGTSGAEANGGKHMLMRVC